MPANHEGKPCVEESVKVHKAIFQSFCSGFPWTDKYFLWKVMQMANCRAIPLWITTLNAYFSEESSEE